MERLKLASSLDQQALARYVARQLSHVFPDRDMEPDEIAVALPRTLERLEFNFSHLKSPHYFDGRQARFNHLNTDQYCVFLYYLANTLHRMQGDRSTAAKLFALNKALHAIDLFYEVEMPDVFGVQHPVGVVVGRAKLSNYLFLYQRCTIGGNLALEYPTLGEGVVLFGDTAVIGRTSLGANTWVSVGTRIIDSDIAGGQVVVGDPRSLTLKTARRQVGEHFFRKPSV
jgi:serine O-acetyltransferase